MKTIDDFIHLLVEKFDPLVTGFIENHCPEDNDELKSEFQIIFDCKVTPDTYERDLYITPPEGLGERKNLSELIVEGWFTQAAFDEAAAALEAVARELPEYKENGVFVFPLR